MRIKINRERKGKKQYPAPKEIEIFGSDGGMIATIIFDEGTILVKNHKGAEVQTIITRSDDGYEPKLGSSTHSKWASVGEEQY